MHMGKFYISQKAVHRYRIRHGLVLLLFLQKRKDTLRSRRGGLQHVRHLCHLLDGLGEVPHILGKGLDIPHLNGLLDGQVAAQNGHSHIAQIAHKLHDGHHHAGQELRFPRRIIQLLVRLFKGFYCLLFLVKRLDDIVARIDLLHLAVYISQKFLLSPEIFLGFGHDEGDHGNGNRQHQKRDQCHQRTDGEHHDQHAHHLGHGGDHLCGALIQTLPQRIHVVRDPGKNLPVGHFVKITHRHPVDLLRDCLSEAVGRLLGDPGHDISLDKGKYRAHPIESQRQQQDPSDLFKIHAAGSGHPADQAVENLRRRLPQDLRPQDIEDRAAHRKDQYKQHLNFVDAHIADQLFDGALKILRFFSRSHPMAVSPACRPSSLLSTHGSVPPFRNRFLFQQAPVPTVGIPQSAGILHSPSKVPCGCRSPPLLRRPVQ